MKHALIIATSGRALAQSAVNAGWRCSVLDCFADRDTQVLADRTLALPDAGGLALDARRLVDGALRFAPPHCIDALVCGSGFEHCPELLQELGRHYKLYGNGADTIRRLKDPRQLSALFARIGVAHPEISFRMPADPAGWLAKRAASSGGLHVHWAAETSDRSAGDDRYFQRFVAGRVCSVLFVADGMRSRIVGVSEMLTGGAGPASPFAYRGAIAGISIAPALVQQIAAALDRLVAETGLRGLNGMDFIITGEGYSALEINPRPTATLDLFDAPQRGHLFQAHVDACKGVLPSQTQGDSTVRGHAIVYAHEPLELADHWQTPHWCADLPAAGTIVAGAPLCSIHAAADSASRVTALLHEREIALRAQLSQFSNSNSMKVAA